MDQQELIRILEHGDCFTKEVKSVLLELDTTSSTSTQAYLNELLLMVRKRLLNNEHIIDESTKLPLTLDSYEQWIHNEFTTYSSKMYFDTIRK